MPLTFFKFFNEYLNSIQVRIQEKLSEAKKQGAYLKQAKGLEKFRLQNYGVENSNTLYIFLFKLQNVELKCKSKTTSELTHLQV